MTNSLIESIDYYKRPELSNSDIKLINQSWLHYISKGNFPATPAMNVGSAFHTFILEPEKFNKEFAIKTLNLATKEGKEWKAEQGDKIIIDESDYIWFSTMEERILAHPLNFLFENMEVEKEIYFEYNDVQCRAKLDIINHDIKTIIDLKSIVNCSKAENSVKYDYASQAAFYRQGMYELTGEWYDFVFVFAEKSFPHGVKFINTSEQTFYNGMIEIEKGIEIYKKYKAKPNLYAGYSDSFIEV